MITSDLAEKIIFESKLGGDEEKDHAVCGGGGGGGGISNGRTSL